MNNSSVSYLRKPLALLGAGLSVFAANAAFAQQANPDSAVKLDKFVVTGSFIPVAADAIAIPVTVIGSDEIARTGITTNALEVLKKAVPQFQGNANIGSNNANISSGSTGGGSQASLRNLTTLTLINGRRAAASPITGTGGNQFVDLNIIPLSAIDSIEVLLDGASATYGSDATSGVINIKSKSDYSGAAISGYYEFSDQPGKWATFGGNFVTGASSGKTNITIAGGWSHQDPMYQFERGFSNPQYGTPTWGGTINFGSNYFRLNPAYSAPPVGAVKPVVTFLAGSGPQALAAIPTAPDGKPYFGAVGSTAVYWGKTSSAGAGVIGFGAGELAGATTPEAEQVAFNLSQYVTILQRRDSMGAMATFDHKVTDNITFFGDLLTSQIKTQSQINAQPVGTTADFNVTGAHINNPFATTLRVRNRFVTNPRAYEYDTTFKRLVAGFRGDINDRLSFETAINLNTSDLAYRNNGVIDAAGLLGAAGINPAATGPSAINMFQANIAPATIAAANFIGTAYNNFTSGLRSWDGRILYKAWELESGDVTVVLGSEVRRETLKGTADLNSVPDFNTGAIGWTGATSVNPFKATRDVKAAFLEAMIPLANPKQGLKWAHAFDLDVAGRYEKYSDTEDPLVPKVTFRWLPFNDEFAVRGTWGKSFNAPTLYQLVGPSDVGFTPEVILLPFGAADVPANYVTGQAQIRGGANPALKPARSDAYTVGVVWSPKAVKGLSTELTYWNIKETDIVGVISTQTILQNIENLGATSPYLATNAGATNSVGNFINPLTGRSTYDGRSEGFRASGDPITAPGQVAGNIDSIYIERPLVNIGEQSASGLDLTAKYKWEVPSVGLIDVSANVAYWLEYNFFGENLAGRATITGGTIPRYTAYVASSWKRGNWDAFTSVRYIPKIPAPDEVSSGKTEAEAYASFDVGVGYRFDNSAIKWLNGMRVSVIAKNVGNEAPAQLPDTFSNDSVDTGAYDPIGRTFVISAEFKF